MPTDSEYKTIKRLVAYQTIIFYNRKDMRPIKSGRDAVRVALRYINKWLSTVVDIESEELNFRQRDKLRRKVIRYLLYGDRRRTNNDEQLQAVFEYIVKMYIEPEEIF